MKEVFSGYMAGVLAGSLGAVAGASVLVAKNPGLTCFANGVKLRHGVIAFAAAASVSLGITFLSRGLWHGEDRLTSEQQEIGKRTNVAAGKLTAAL